MSTSICLECQMSAGAHKLSCSHAPRLTKERTYREALETIVSMWQGNSSDADLTDDMMHVASEALTDNSASVVEPSPAVTTSPPSVDVEALKRAALSLKNEVMGNLTAFEFEIREVISNTNYQCILNKVLEVGAILAGGSPVGLSVKSNAEWQLGPNTTHAHCACIINGTFVDSSKCPVHGLSQRT